MVDAGEKRLLVARGSPSPGSCGLGKGKADGVWWELGDQPLPCRRGWVLALPPGIAAGAPEACLEH